MSAPLLLLILVVLAIFLFGTIVLFRIYGGRPRKPPPTKDLPANPPPPTKRTVEIVKAPEHHAHGGFPLGLVGFLLGLGLIIWIPYEFLTGAHWLVGGGWGVMDTVAVPGPLNLNNLSLRGPMPDQPFQVVTSQPPASTPAPVTVATTDSVSDGSQPLEIPGTIDPSTGQPTRSNAVAIPPGAHIHLSERMGDGYWGECLNPDDGSWTLNATNAEGNVTNCDGSPQERFWSIRPDNSGGVLPMVVHYQVRS